MLDNGDVSTDESTEPATVPIPPRRVGVLIAVAVLAVALDAITKHLVVADIEGKPAVKVLGGLVYLDVIRNPGAAFSMATGMTWILSLVALGVVVAIIWVSPRLRSVGWAIGLGLVLAGALGNLSDRVFRSPGPLRGHVVDFISVFQPYGRAFAIFNVADSAITCGAVVIVLMALLGKDYDGGIAKQAQARTTATDSATAGSVTNDSVTTDSPADEQASSESAS
jgi:signal peptidase II